MIARIVGDARVEALEFEAGPPRPRDAIFVTTRKRQSSNLAPQLGCEHYDSAGCTIENLGRSNVPGLYIIGHALRDVLQVAVAAGDGVQAAISIHSELLKEDLAPRPPVWALQSLVRGAHHE